MTRPRMCVLAILVLGARAPARCHADDTLRVTYASLSASKTPSGARATVVSRVEFEFAEDHLTALMDDEAEVSISVLDRDGRGSRHDLEDLEDCRMLPDGSMPCPAAVLFQRVSQTPARWKLALGFAHPGPDAFRGPVTVRFSYSVSGGTRTVHSGTIRGCWPARGGSTVICQVPATTVR